MVKVNFNSKSANAISGAIQSLQNKTELSGWIEAAGQYTIFFKGEHLNSPYPSRQGWEIEVDRETWENFPVVLFRHDRGFTTLGQMPEEEIQQKLKLNPDLIVEVGFVFRDTAYELLSRLPAEVSKIARNRLFHDGDIIPVHVFRPAAVGWKREEDKWWPVLAPEPGESGFIEALRECPEKFSTVLDGDTVQLIFDGPRGPYNVYSWSATEHADHEVVITMWEAMTGLSRWEVEQ